MSTSMQDISGLREQIEANAAYLWPGGSFSILLFERDSKFQAVVMRKTDAGDRIVAFGSHWPAPADACLMLLGELAAKTTAQVYQQPELVENSNVFLASPGDHGWVEILKD